MASIFSEKDMVEYCGDKAACVVEERVAVDLQYIHNTSQMNNHMMLFWREIMILHMRWIIAIMQSR